MNDNKRKVNFETLLDEFASASAHGDTDDYNEARTAVIAAHHEACLRSAEDAHAAAMRAALEKFR